MKEEHESALRQILHMISEATEPGEMTLKEALDFTKELQSHLEGVVDGLKDNIANGEGGANGNP